MSENENYRDLLALLEEFVRLHRAGEAPDPLEFAKRAGAEAPRMRELIALFLAESVPVSPTPAAARDLVERYGPRPELLSDQLLQRFVRQHLRGEAPDPLEFAERAGAEAPRMRELIALFLAESEPVSPTPAAARDLVERYGPRPEPVSARESEKAAGWPELLRELIDHWRAANAEVREAFADRLAESAPVLRLAPIGYRGAARGDESASIIVQLDHHKGGRAVLEGETLIVVLYGMPADFVGSRPFLAFPHAQQPGVPELEWAGTSSGLPAGLIRAETVDAGRRELRATVGTMRGSRDSLEALLAGIRVIPDEAIA